MSQPRTDKYLKEKKQHVGSSVYIGEFPFFLESHLSSPGSLMLSKMIGGGVGFYLIFLVVISNSICLLLATLMLKQKSLVWYNILISMGPK